MAEFTPNNMASFDNFFAGGMFFEDSYGQALNKMFEFDKLFSTFLQHEPDDYYVKEIAHKKLDELFPNSDPEKTVGWDFIKFKENK